MERLYETSESLPGSHTSTITNNKGSVGANKGTTKGISECQNEIELKSSDTGGGGNIKMFIQQLLLQQKQMQQIMVELKTIKKEKKQMESFDGGVVARPNKEWKGMTSTITKGVYVSERDMDKLLTISGPVKAALKNYIKKKWYSNMIFHLDEK